MARFGLCFYLALLTLAEPCVCCCSAARFAALFGGAVQTGHSPASCRKHGRCSRHERARQTSRYAHNKSPGQPGEQHRTPCPCRQHRADSAALLSLDTETAQALQRRHSTPGLGESLVGPVSRLAWLPKEDGLAFGVPRVLPFLTCQDILNSMHKLRC